MPSNSRDNSIKANIDWPIILIYGILMTFGLLNVYAAEYSPDKGVTEIPFKQLMWIGVSAVVILVIMLLELRLYHALAYVVYAFCIILLLAALLFGTEDRGARAWIQVGGFRLQPSEFAKIGIAIALSKFLSDPNKRLMQFNNLVGIGFIILLPATIIVLQNETGSTLVYASFAFMLFREGLPGILLAFGGILAGLFISALFVGNADLVPQFLTFIEIVGVLIAAYFLSYKISVSRFVAFIVLDLIIRISVLVFVVEEYAIIINIVLLVIEFLVFLVLYLFSPSLRNKISQATLVMFFAVVSTLIIFGTDYFVNKLLKPHQRARIEAFIDPNPDNPNAYQLIQSKIAIGSGGVTGKGYLKGTQAQMNFVPDQNTDFIFSIIGEEHGWIGALTVIGLFVALLYRLIIMAERQRLRFSRVFIYCVMGIFLFHFIINIGMTIGFMPVIGIPLPFFSYGGSGLLSFHILLYLAIKFDSHRMQLLSRL